MRNHSVALLACAFALSLLAGSFHRATEPHELAARPGRLARIEPTLSPPPCHAPAHRSHPSDDHDCVLDEEAAPRHEGIDAPAVVDDAPSPSLLALVEPREMNPPLHDDAPPDRVRGPTQGSRAPPAS